MEDQTIIQTGKKKNTFLKERAVLLTLSSGNLGKTWVINQEETIIGRASSCDIQIKDPGISARHCCIRALGGAGFELEDLGSTNGTYLNKKLLKKPTSVFYSDRLVLGKTVLRFFLEETLDHKN